MTRQEKSRIQFIPDFDSSSAMLFSLANFLSGSEDGVGLPPKLPKMLGDFLNVTPEALRESIYLISGVQESLSVKHLRRIDDEYISSWVSDRYPARKYPAVVIGSSNGALIHLCAMLDIPWIPQTVLLAVSRKMDPDELIQDAEWGRQAARIVREKIPYIKMYQMHDPVQDRVMVANMGYFRAKRVRLGRYLEKYLEQILMPGGTIFISDCQLRWPAARIGEGHSFQTGGLGAVDGKEYAEGSERIREFLRNEGASRTRWELPDSLQEMPEAEWGYDDELTDDLRRYASEREFKLRRIVYRHPEELSAPAAELTRHWYQKNGIDSRRLLVECFALIEPWWAAKTGSIPYWMPFNTSASFQSVQRYMEGVESFDEIYLMLMSNAVRGIGSVSIEEWKTLLRRARRRGEFIGVDEEKFPHDLGSYIKYHKDLRKKIGARYPMSRPLGIDEFLKLVDAQGIRVRGEE
ncbi:MAG: hypothetical protein GF333_03030 [Candidatus Omnitrophica bacterium]|nr:hypothetical protein [Candidatus Omnitrophota bacterium]